MSTFLKLALRREEKYVSRGDVEPRHSGIYHRSDVRTRYFKYFWNEILYIKKETLKAKVKWNNELN